MYHLVYHLFGTMHFSLRISLLLVGIPCHMSASQCPVETAHEVTGLSAFPNFTYTVQELDYRDGGPLTPSCVYDRLEHPGTLPVPRAAYYVEPIWKALRYGWALGAPVTPAAQRMFAQKTRHSRAVLCCFYTAGRLSEAAACPKQKGVWAAMAAVPSALVENIIVFADLDIPESMIRRAPQQQSPPAVQQ